MSVSLVKGQKVDLTKGNPGLTNILVGLGWDVNKFDASDSFDMDVSVFLVGSDGKVTSDSDFIFYNNATHSSGSVIYSGDNRTGEGSGDDETMQVKLNKVPSNIEKIVFCASIYDAESRCHNFGMIDNSYIRIVDEDKNEELFKYELDEDFSTETGLIAGEIYRHNGEWKFKAVGQGTQGALEYIARLHGVNLG